MPTICPPFWNELDRTSGSKHQQEQAKRKQAYKQQTLPFSVDKIQPGAAVCETPSLPKGVKIIGKPPKVPPMWVEPPSKGGNGVWNGWTREWVAAGKEVEARVKRYLEMMKFLHSLGLWAGEGYDIEQTEKQVKRNLALWQSVDEPSYKEIPVGMWVENWRVILPPLLKRKANREDNDNA